MAEPFNDVNPRRVYASVPSIPNTPTMEYPNSPFPPSPSTNYSPMMKETFSKEEEQVASWPSTPVPPEIMAMNLKLKKRIRIIRFSHRLVLTILAICAASLEAQILSSFLKTHNIQRDGRGPWAKETSLWPSIMLLTSSSITALIGIIEIAAYAFSLRAANYVDRMNSNITYTMELIGLTMWIIVAILYRTGRSGHDLWGWSCSPLAVHIQPSFEGIVNFRDVCQRGATNWELSLASAAANLFSVMVWYYSFRRWKTQRLLKSYTGTDNARIEAVQGKMS